MAKVVKPLGDRVFVRLNDKKEMKTESGIILSNTATEQEKVYGEVVSVGQGIFTQNGARIPMTVKPGDEVMFVKAHASNEIKIGDEKLYIFREHDLIGYISN